MTTQENVECVICLEPRTSPTVLECCRQPCHAQCVNQWKNTRHTISCPHCRQVIPITVLEVTYPELRKEDVHFVNRVKNVWKDNRLWYGTRHDENGSKLGFWGELKDPYEADKKPCAFSVTLKVKSFRA